jgi:hypothetical protein
MNFDSETSSSGKVIQKDPSSDDTMFDPELLKTFESNFYQKMNSKEGIFNNLTSRRRKLHENVQ